MKKKTTKSVKQPTPITTNLVQQQLFGTELSIKDNLLLTNFGELPPCKWFKVPGMEGLFVKTDDPFRGFDILSGSLHHFEEQTQVLGIKKVNLYLN